MSAETKLAWKKFALKLARKILWRLDEWLHAQELKLRVVVEPITAPALVSDLKVEVAAPAELNPGRERKPANSRAKRRRGVTASAFDLRFSNPTVQP